MKKQKAATRNIAYIALGAALISLSALITLPFAIPFTLQSFGLFAVLAILGGKRGLLAVVCYILIGLVGLPVFSGFRGGIAAITGPTGGFIAGFLAAALLFWLFEALFGKKAWAEITAASLGMLACYGLGAAWYCLYTGNIGFWAALSTCVLPYIIPDTLKIFLAFRLARLKSVPKI